MIVDRFGSAVLGLVLTDNDVRVSLDNESAEAGCTELVKDFHRHINTWWMKYVSEQLPPATGSG